MKKKKEESPGLWKEVEEGCFINIFAQIYSKCFCKMILGIRLFILTKYLYALFSDKLNCTVIQTLTILDEYLILPWGNNKETCFKFHGEYAEYIVSYNLTFEEKEKKWSILFQIDLSS